MIRTAQLAESCIGPFLNLAITQIKKAHPLNGYIMGTIGLKAQPVLSPGS